jgi:hypothetical protein
MKNGNVVGGITAYELRKFEREHSEINLYGVGENSRPHSPIRCSQSTPPRDVMP